MSKQAPNPDWRQLVSRLIKSEMSKRALKYDELSKRLAEQGTEQTAANLRNKINRGILGADLFLQIILAMDVNSIDRDTLREILDTLDS